MREDIKNHRSQLISLFNDIEVTDSGNNPILLDEALENVINLIIEQANEKGKLIFIGNGGSAAIASHMATDFWKNAGIKAMTFNDSTLLTCLSNDEGYDNVFGKSIDMFAEENDVLISISSSGNSANIIKGTAAAKNKKLKVITFTGFEPNNSLRPLGDYNFYVPKSHYGHVEVIHHALVHSLIDIIIEHSSKLKERVVFHEQS